MMILEAKNIQKVYDHSMQKLHVLRGINLSVEESAFMSIVGPSGAGKSTLLHILGGLDKPSEGQVLMAGEDIYAMNDRQRTVLRNQEIGFIFQFYHLLPEFTALENVILPGLIKSDLKNKKEIEQRGLSLLERVGLKMRTAHKPNQLSGGEQQRVAIARALMNSPKIIFCDEPTGNLDSQSGQEIIRLLVELNQEKKQTIIIVTHDKNIAEVSHLTIHMRDGQLYN